MTIPVYSHHIPFTEHSLEIHTPRSLCNILTPFSANIFACKWPIPHMRAVSSSPPLVGTFVRRALRTRPRISSPLHPTPASFAFKVRRSPPPTTDNSLNSIVIDTEFPRSIHRRRRVVRGSFNLTPSLWPPSPNNSHTSAASPTHCVCVCFFCLFNHINSNPYSGRVRCTHLVVPEHMLDYDEAVVFWCTHKFVGCRRRSENLSLVSGSDDVSLSAAVVAPPCLALSRFLQPFFGRCK